MPYSTYHFGPAYTPLIVKRLIIITCLITLTSALLNPIFTKFLEMPGLQEYLSLSWWGLSNFFIWQPFTHLFVQNTALNGVTFFFLIALFFLLLIPYHLVVVPS